MYKLYQQEVGNSAIADVAVSSFGVIIHSGSAQNMLTICLFFFPVPSSRLMFNVSVLMASSMYSTMAIPTSGNQCNQWRRETLVV